MLNLEVRGMMMEKEIYGKQMGMQFSQMASPRYI